MADSLHVIARPDSVASTSWSDSVRTLPAIVVRAKRPDPREVLERLPGHVSVVDLAQQRDRITTAAEVIARLPGLHVSNYGGLGAYSTVSIRGSGAGQVSVYLDGVPLTRAGLGVANLSDLPFAALDRIEVYRGFAPAELPGASLGGAINLVTRGARPGGPPLRRSAVVAGGGSFGTQRVGFSQEIVEGGWSGLVVGDHLESDGDFRFADDNGTPLNHTDDEVVARHNNWFRSDEVLARLGRAMPGAGELRILNQWVRHQQGVPGVPNVQATQTRAGTQYDVTSAEAFWPGLGHGRVGFQGRLFHEWRRDTFADPKSEIGLGYQDNRDVSRTLGSHLTLRGRLPGAQQLTLDLEARRERYIPWRRYPRLQEGPEQVRDVLELGLEERLTIAGRAVLHAGLRATRRNDRFSGDLRTPYSQRPAHAASDADLAPRLGLRLPLGLGLQLRANYGEYQRVPGFQELFGDGGSLAGSSDLVAETGIDRDIGLEWAGRPRGLDVHVGVVHFYNRAEHLITFLPQSQRTFVARNIGSASMQGEEWSWRADSGRRWSMEGGFTRLDARDLGTDQRWYAGKALPGRPARQFDQRFAVTWGAVQLGYDYESLGQNYLDRWNREVVARRDLHGFDARAGWRGYSVQVGLRNVTDERAVDVAGFPLPGRTFFATAAFKL